MASSSAYLSLLSSPTVKQGRNNQNWKRTPTSGLNINEEVFVSPSHLHFRPF